MDGTGNVFIADRMNNRVVVMQRAQPPSLTFNGIARGSTSDPQVVTIQNIGNQPLNAIGNGLGITPNAANSIRAGAYGSFFVQVAGSGTPADCTSSFALAPGGSCNFSISFTSAVVGGIPGAVLFTDNALNTSPSATQSMTLLGVGSQ